MTQSHQSSSNLIGVGQEFFSRIHVGVAENMFCSFVGFIGRDSVGGSLMHPG